MDLVIRASVVYFAIYAITRGFGRRELAELAPFELVVLVVMGDLIQQGVTQEDYSITGAIVAISTMAVWSLLLSYVGFKSNRARDVIDGVPAIVYRDDEPLMDVLYTHRLTLQDLLEAAHDQGIGDLNELDWAVLEPDGKFSFIKGPGDNSQGQDQKNKAAE